MKDLLVRTGLTHILDHFLFARAKPHGPRLSQAERPVGATAVLVRVAIVLSVVLPEADLTNLKCGLLAEGLPRIVPNRRCYPARRSMRPTRYAHDDFTAVNSASRARARHSQPSASPFDG